MGQGEVKLNSLKNMSIFVDFNLWLSIFNLCYLFQEYLVTMYLKKQLGKFIYPILGNN